MQDAATAAFQLANGAETPTIASIVEPLSTDRWSTGEIRVREAPTGIMLTPTRAILPAGRYFLGDPCYTAGKDDAAWQQWVDVADEGSNGFTDKIVGGSYNGHPVIACSTAHGDGSYMSSFGDDFAVDAGLIGVVPGDVIDGMGLSDTDLDGMGVWVTVDRPTTLTWDEDGGRISFGEHVVYTDDDDGDEDYDWSQDDDDW